MDKILCQLCDYKDSPDCPHNSNICHSFRSEDKDCLRIVTKTAHLVAQDILDELEEKCNCYPDFDFMDAKGACPACRRNIKSKWGIE